MDPTETDGVTGTDHVIRDDSHSVDIVVEDDHLYDVPVDDAAEGDGGGNGPAWLSIESLATWAIVLVSCGFVLYSLHPDLIFANTTPTGGDMGAHVWGPRFLRDELLPQFRAAGWTQDWYAGFPAYLFYMVVPSLMIVWVSTSPPMWLVPFLLIGLGLVSWKGIPRIATPWIRRAATTGAVMAAILFVPIPYNIAFKLVAVSGLVTLPFAACMLARSLAAPFPVPPLVALATLPFIYDKGFTILGGNGASTMAGEFAFSISLTFALLYLATLFAGARTGRWRAPGAVLLALTVLCHIIPAIFAVVVTLVVVPFLRRQPAEADLAEVPASDADGGAAPDTGDELALDASPDPYRDMDHSGEESVADPLVAGPSVGTPPVDDLPGPEVPDDTRADSEPWWSESRRGAFAAGLVIVATVGLVLVDRSWLRDTAGHVPGRSGVAGWQFLFPVVASIAAMLFFTGFTPRLARRVKTPVGSIMAIVLTIGVGVGLILRPSNWAMAIALVLLGLVHFVEVDRDAIRWIISVSPVAALVTGFWMLPFLAGSTYMNDMGWEKYTRYWDYLLAVPELESGGMPLRSYVLVAAGLGLVLSVLMKVRLGWFLGLVVVVFAWMFRYFPQYRLWNARLLPFYFLALYMLAGLGGALVIRFVADLFAGSGSGRPVRRTIRWVGAVGALILVLGALLGSFKVLPGGKVELDPDRSEQSVYKWGPLRFPVGIVPDWASWNFSGIERKAAYDEFRGVVDMMDNIGHDVGCGRAFWEFHPELNRFGTTMALMMLPYYTDGCIASMEGLYFEASTTTPFHFLMQSALSSSPSRAQREMPYPAFDLDLGIRQMQMLGVRYYMASSDQAITAAEDDPRLDKLADRTFDTADGTTNRWAIFEVSGIRLVEGMLNTPVVLSDANDHIDGWVYAEDRLEPTEAQAEVGSPGSKTAGPAVNWFMSPARWDVFLASSGPRDWVRTTADEAMDHADPLPAVSVTNLAIEGGRVSFDVDRVGVPVLVRESYFPNWRVSGAEGPYRVTPNFMVVVPTEEHVVLSYGRSVADLAGGAMTVVGLIGLVGLAVLDDRHRRSRVAAAERRGAATDAQ